MATTEDVSVPDITSAANTTDNDPSLLGVDSNRNMKRYNIGMMIATRVFQTVNNFSSIVQSGSPRIIFVLSDETDANEAKLYIWTGTKLVWLVTQDL
jgi:hypothetical protein